MDCDDCVESCTPSSTPSYGEGRSRRPARISAAATTATTLRLEARFPRAASRLLTSDVAVELRQRVMLKLEERTAPTTGDRRARSAPAKC